MKRYPSSSIAFIVLLFSASPAFAGPCKAAIDRLQAQVDAAIDRNAGAGPWKPESVDALRGYQPTPGSIAAAEGPPGRGLERALNRLARARAADRHGDPALCRLELDKARRALASR
ncbi:hypothetical protein [Bradyrhizobium sp. ARR65]|uniref:hypothetical protein n=1 Tax=Bradyrhizobium sp. ARR65 TaxID=1040989 RepID=UPI00054D006D|nr:hypothetical protein [Bradyrhizobium sp. ARR65]